MADAKPSPRDAPVMTTARFSSRTRSSGVRSSAILATRRAPVARRTQLDVGIASGPLLPGGPLAYRVRPLGSVRPVEPLWVIDLGFGEGPRAGDGGRRAAGLDDPEPAAVGEVRHVDDREHHQ